MLTKLFYNIKRGIFALLFFHSMVINAQVINVNTGWFSGAALYNENGTRLSSQEVESLVEQGFDVQQYKELRRKTIITESVVAISYTAGAYACVRSELYAKEHNNGIQYDAPALVIGSSAMVTLLIAGLYKHRINKELEKKIAVVNRKISIHPSTEGVGLCLMF